MFSSTRVFYCVRRNKRKHSRAECRTQSRLLKLLDLFIQVEFKPSAATSCRWHTTLRKNNLPPQYYNRWLSCAVSSPPTSDRLATCMTQHQTSDQIRHCDFTALFFIVTFCVNKAMLVPWLGEFVAICQRKFPSSDFYVKTSWYLARTRRLKRNRSLHIVA